MAKHSPTRYNTYFETHARCMEQLKASGVVLYDGLELEPFGSGFLKISGIINCRGNLVLTVDKILKLQQNEGVIVVQTYKYAYNLSLAGQGNIFRYDNAHKHPGHQIEHHLHRFEPPGREVVGSPFETGEDWPTLTEVLREADLYYWENIFYSG